MEKIEFVFQFMRHLFWSLILEGILLVLIGVMIFIYPELLGMLVGFFLVISGIMVFVLAAKVSKYSKLKVEM
jgi:hypothetical protein